DRLSIDLSNMFYDLSEQLIAQYQDQRDFEGFTMELISTFAIDVPFTEEEFMQGNTNDLAEKLFEHVSKDYKHKTEILSERAYPIIESVYKREGQRYENIAIPITDGHKTLNVIAPLKKCFESGGKEIILSIEKGINLSVIDDSWKEHLREMDELKQSVQNASYEQKDPLLIYKFESFELFKQMLHKINKEITSFLSKGKLPMDDAQDVKEARLPQSDISKSKAGRDDIMGNRTSEPRKTQPIIAEKKVGRNEPCPCGSGKKFKNCHGA
ncbi:MAG: SEC-C metal-binding domain-containing protein, partial [Bacteroidales bacterium]|nr:SEC-C metal-binding domain-containing protein [Bacteroidales bacterium]